MTKPKGAHAPRVGGQGEGRPAKKLEIRRVGGKGEEKPGRTGGPGEGGSAGKAPKD